ncbi:MAG: YVTN family beta-propeller repeat-containing protein [Treponema sp.]|nr:YVTN family beta-propeller repeat-containing protein [Treponema sp.]
MKIKKIHFTLSLLYFFVCLTVASQPVLTKTGTFGCGKQPKQVLFSPDDKYVVMPLLDEDGFDIFDVENKKLLKRINPPSAKKLGFAEGLFIPEKNSFFVSQMTTATIYEYSYPGFEFKRSISTEGNWSKFMVWNSKKQIIAVSNWVSNDISIIDYATGKVLRKIPTAAAPRGLWFLKDGEEILSLGYEGGKIEKFEVDTGKKLNTIAIKNSAMRHVVVNAAETKAYISDMYYRSVYEVDLAEFKITKQAKVFNNPNTVDLYQDRYLFVSSRGPNNPEDYTKRSPKNGKITILDTTDFSILQEIEGGNQPTGLDVSNNGKYLCFSNFQDADIELYSLTEKK